MIGIAPRGGLLLLLLALAGGCRSAEVGTAQAAVKASTIALQIRGNHAVQVFNVEVARTADEQERGLMFRRSLPPKGGMLFPFDPPQMAAFWMKNTYIPLDMIFIRSDGTIARIAANTTPLSLEPVSAGETVSAVLEIAGGAAAASGIAEGDRVSWPRIPD